MRTISKGRSSQVRAVLSETRGLDDGDLEEVTLYAQFRKAPRQRRKEK